MGHDQPFCAEARDRPEHRLAIDPREYTAEPSRSRCRRCLAMNRSTPRAIASLTRSNFDRAIGYAADLAEELAATHEEACS
jgi:hypothetical protein